MLTRYRNPWYEKADVKTGAEYFDVENVADLEEYRGFIIHKKDSVCNIVKGDVFLAQYANLEAAKARIDKCCDEKMNEFKRLPILAI